MLKSLLTALVAFGNMVSFQQVSEPPVYRAKSDLVFLNVTVTDRDGRPVEGLRSDDFRIYEDGIEQRIRHFDPASAPVAIGLALDRSGSMSPMIDEVYRAALHVTENAGSDDEFFALTFNDTLLLEQGWTAEPDEVKSALRGLRADGGTALFDAVSEGIRLLEGSRLRRKVLCVITDGEDTVSRTHFDEVLDLAEESEVLIYPSGMVKDMPLINWGPFGSRSVRQLKKLAGHTGGRAHFPRNLDDCRRTMEEISEELHSLYGLGYYPSDEGEKGQWRELKVELSKERKGLRVRAREGYRVGSSRPSATEM